jgi:multidrug efflux pump subunit AcrB
MIETWVKLKPREQWRAGMTVEKLIKEMDAATKMPGLVNSWGYPIKIRLDMVTTGIRTPVGVKISGGDLNVISDLALQVEQAVKNIPGTRSAFADRVVGAKYLEIEPNRDAIARYGIDLGTVQEVLVDGPSEDPAFPWEGRTAAQAPEIDGVVYLRELGDADLRPGRRVSVRIVEVDGYDLVGEPLQRA